jgi:eukaryotic-like serine/threonine-protein kinase
VVVRRGLQYLLARRILQLLLAVPVGALAYTLIASRHLTIAELLTENLTSLSSVVLLGAGLRFRSPLHLWLDRRFFREQYDSERVLIGLVDRLAGSGSIADLSRYALTEIDLALHPSAMHLWHVDSAGDPDAPPADVKTILERQAHPVQVPRLAEAGAHEVDVDRLARLGWQLIVPIRSGDERLVGALMLGEKRSEEPYGANDQRLLLAIAKEIAIVWDNLRLRAQVGEEQRIRHTVLARLDRDAVRLLKECPACGTCYDAEAERCTRDGRPLVLSLPVERTIERRYRLDRLIGKGGMGAVYEARDLRLERQVAVKIMVGRAFGDAQALRRFQREARAVARLNHPNIVSVHDCGSLAGEGAYLVMERLDGVTLRAELHRARRLAPGAAADWFDQLLAGVGAAHEHGVVHRDLKPENVIAHQQGRGAWTVKILDFGLAKFRPLETAATGTVTIGGAIMGTMGYMSPEQLLGGDVDERSDLFTLGVMLVEVLTGSRPFAGTSYPELLSAVTSQAYQLPDPLAAVTALDDLVRRCLRKDPAERVASAVVLRQELIPVLRACPPLVATPQPAAAEAETCPENPLRAR